MRVFRLYFGLLLFHTRRTHAGCWIKLSVLFSLHSYLYLSPPPFFPLKKRNLLHAHASLPSVTAAMAVFRLGLEPIRWSGDRASGPTSSAGKFWRGRQESSTEQPGTQKAEKYLQLCPRAAIPFAGLPADLRTRTGIGTEPLDYSFASICVHRLPERSQNARHRPLLRFAIASLPCFPAFNPPIVPCH